MQERDSQSGFRAGRPVDITPLQKARVSQDRSIRMRRLLTGGFYVGLFCLALFGEVFLKTRLKSYSLDIWLLERRKVEVESEITKLDMRLTVLESPMRIESLASSEIGLTAAKPQKEPPAR